MRKLILSVLVLLALLLTAVWAAWANFNLSAFQEPSHFETYAASKAKRALVAREARGIVPRPATPQSLSNGEMNFEMRCAMCHGRDGRNPSEAGAWMNPPARNLASPEVQRWSDAELFWIIKNGVRFTGMPGFGKVADDEEIWSLVHHIRQIGKEAGR